MHESTGGISTMGVIVIVIVLLLILRAGRRSFWAGLSVALIATAIVAVVIPAWTVRRDARFRGYKQAVPEMTASHAEHEVYAARQRVEEARARTRERLRYTQGSESPHAKALATYTIEFRDSRIEDLDITELELSTLVRAVLATIVGASESETVPISLLEGLPVVIRGDSTRNLASCARVKREKSGKSSERDANLIWLRLKSDELPLEEVALALSQTPDAMRWTDLEDNELVFSVHRNEYRAQVLDLKTTAEAEPQVAATPAVTPTAEAASTSTPSQPTVVASSATEPASAETPATAEAAATAAEAPATPEAPATAEAAPAAEAASAAEVAVAAAVQEPSVEQPEVQKIEKPARRPEPRAVTPYHVNNNPPLVQATVRQDAANDGTPPLWITKPPESRDGIYYLSGNDGPWSTTEECQQHAIPLALRLANEYARLHVGSEDSKRIELTNNDLSLMQCLKNTFIEPVESPSLGKMYQVHVLLSFDNQDRAWIMRRLNENLIHRRITYVGIASVALLGVIGAVFGFLRLDTATRGFYSRRLIAAAGLLIAVIGFAALATLGLLVY